MMELGAVVAGSFLGSAHCIGMCGGLAGAIGATRASIWPTLARQMIFTTGRIFTYSFLGAVGGFAGLSFSRFQTSLVGVQQVFSCIAGLIMLYVGMSVLGLWPFNQNPAGTQKASVQSGVASLLAPIFNHLLNVRGGLGFFLAGLATGFLPCGLVYAFLALAAASGSVLHGLVLMACFGLGTAPAMLMVGCGSSVLSHTTRGRVFRVAACFMIIMGIMTIYRTFPHRHASHTPSMVHPPA